MQTDDIVKQVFDKLNEEIAKMGHVNIIIAGKTGVGKSTLINGIFGKKLAETGTGSPITKEIREITVPNYPLRLYDTVGLELSEEQQESVKGDVLSIIKNSRVSGMQID